MAAQRPWVDQLVFRWDADNRSGNTGFGLVAWSCALDGAEEVRRLVATKLQVAGGAAAPGLVRIAARSRGEVLLVRREPGRDPGGRPGTVCHALLGPPRALPVETCLGLHRWSWPGSGIPLSEVSGRLDRVDADTLARAAAPWGESLAGALPRVAGPLAAAVAEVLRHPGSRYSFLDARGGEFPHLILWGLHGIFRGLRARHPLGWSFATHDSGDSEPFRFVFVPRWPASASHDPRRVRADLGAPRDDLAMEAATELVHLHLGHLRRAREGEPAVAAALADAGRDLERWEAGDGLLRAARRAVRDLSGLSAAARPNGAAPPQRTAREAGRSGDGDREQNRERDRERDRERTREPDRERSREPAPRNMAREIRACADPVLLRSLRNDLPSTTVAPVLREIAHRYAGWSPELRRQLCATALDKDLFLGVAPHHESRSEENRRAENAVWAYHRAVRPLAGEREVSERLETLLPALRAREDSASRAAARAILEDGELPGLPEGVWRAVLRADRERRRERRAPNGPQPPPLAESAPRGPGRHADHPVTRTRLPGSLRGFMPPDREQQPLGWVLVLVALVVVLVGSVVALAVG